MAGLLMAGKGAVVGHRRHPVIGTAISNVRRHPSRGVAVLLAIMISVGYLTSTLTFMATQSESLLAQVSERTAAADVVISSERLGGRKMISKTSPVAALPGVAMTALSYRRYETLNRSSPIEIQNLQSEPRFRWARLAQGTWPDDDHQIAIGRTTAEQQHLQIGDKITVAADNTEQQLKISGITDETQSVYSSLTQTGFVRQGAITQPAKFTVDQLVIGDGSVEPAELAQRIDDQLGAKLKVRTADAYGNDQLKRMTNRADVLGSLVLTFGAISVLVGAILIVNTFLILLAQRRRQIGLLRTVGASRHQIRSSTMIEAVILALLGSAFGVGLGIGVAAAIASATNAMGQGLVVPPTVAIAAAVGILITVAAALLPARRASRLSPLEALRPVDSVATVRRRAVLGAVGSLVLSAGGAVLILVSQRPESISAVPRLESLLVSQGVHLEPLLRSHPLPVCIAGSVALTVGVLFGARYYFGLLLKVFGLLALPFGSVGRLATANSRRHRGRAAATGAALMLAVGLIVTLQVGAASIKASTDLTIDQHYPVDITVASSKPLAPAVVDRVGEINGIERTTLLKSAVVGIQRGEHAKLNRKEALRVPMEAGAGVHSVINDGTAAPAGAVPADRVLIDPGVADRGKIGSGDTITVGYRGKTRTMIAEPSRVAARRTALVAPSTLASIAPNADAHAVWAKATPQADPINVNADLTDVRFDHPGLQIHGSLTNRAAYAQLLDTLVVASTVLLGVAVVIAVIGVGNTLGLSVLERARESALLRALGLQRWQLRAMLGIEAALLALGASVIGIVAGIFFGWAGSTAIGQQLDYRSVVFTMSFRQTAVVAAVALLAAVVASILPAARAARTAPVRVLADD